MFVSQHTLASNPTDNAYAMKSYWKHTVPVPSNQTVFPAHWVHTSPQDMLSFLRNSFGKALRKRNLV